MFMVRRDSLTGMQNSSAAIELIGIDKRFGHVHANKDIHLSVPAGTIHGIIGENGAGKSTLMSILYGFYEADRGEIRVFGQTVDIQNSQDAIRSGIGMVHQHFMLVDRFTVLENVMLGAENSPWLNRGMRSARAELQRLEAEYGLDVDVDQRVEELPVGLQQRVEILKALYRGARILILDEPTGVLTPQETDRLFGILRALKKQGTTVILITHKLREIMAITDNVSVMRAGEMVAHRPTAATSKEELAELMVGRKVLLRVEKTENERGRIALRADHLTVIDTLGVRRVDAVSFHVRAGEIVGIAGVSGNGQSELLQTLSGILPVSSGSFQVNDITVSPEAPLDPHMMRRLQLAHVPEDRLRMGLVPAFQAAESAILGYHDDAAYNGRILMKTNTIIRSCQRMMKDFDVRPIAAHLKTANFSGGNQQKLVLAREMQRQPLILLVGQPTRGVDIGAIEFIHKQLISMRDQGCAVLLVSVELDEIMALSDRILVMFEGRIVGEVTADEADERTLGLMMANAHTQPGTHTSAAAEAV
jgi:simple sugar transport system ATP-binding protein